MTKQQNLADVSSRIEAACLKANRKPDDVALVAVTKTIDAAGIEELYSLGLRNFGENRVDVFLEKVEALKAHPGIKWHFIGSLQTRKVRQVLPHIDYLHSLDRPSLAAEIEKRAERDIDCFLEVNISGEASKHGFTKEEAIEFLTEASFQHIRIIGLMTMAPLTQDETELHQVFHELKELQQRVASLDLNRVPCTELSMGMTNDYEIAIQEGATYIRVGRALVNDEIVEV
ncbi:YggS family pyridoxal phosphate-dependent enzyme [Listeria costaricensis]|uniref:YggS family pyridoxal phosphate-dependent enzyme n=1 Tax=Listeria costaricensis TaxID=2026604 RepID=UPI000C0783A7|nr:YggS family pyridoxal phosphate-dependent enzyme [Listeria costaricensis]